MRATTTFRNLAVISLLAFAPLAAGCGGDSGGGSGGGAVPAEPSAPSKDFKSEAEKEINADNMNTELEKLKTDIESDK